MKLQIGLPLMFIGRSTIFEYANGVNITNNISISYNKDYVEIIKILINMIKNLNHVTFALNIKNLTIFRACLVRVFVFCFGFVTFFSIEVGTLILI